MKIAVIREPGIIEVQTRPKRVTVFGAGMRGILTVLLESRRS
jgi:hypothetical protein